MRTTRTAWLALTVLAVLVAPGVSSAQTAENTSPPIEVGGFRLEGYGEAGVRFFGERPTQKESAKFEEYRDINQGLYLQGLWLRFFTPDEKYSGVISGRQWGLQDQEYHLSFERTGRWEAGFDWDQMRHIFSTSAQTLLNEIDLPRGLRAAESTPPDQQPRHLQQRAGHRRDQRALGHRAPVLQARGVRQRRPVRRIYPHPQGW